MTTNYEYSKSNVAVLILLIAALLLLLGGFPGERGVEMTNVGGKMNNCTCSQRLER